MREILFKAKRIDNGEWVEGHYYSQVYHEGTIGEEWYHFIKPMGSESWERIRVNPGTICQYTGLTDKNGNKIWENDIVLFTLETEQGKTELMKQVKYRRNGRISPFWWEFECHVCDAYNKVENVVVLGNIFDNYELLKERAE